MNVYGKFTKLEGCGVLGEMNRCLQRKQQGHCEANTYLSSLQHVLEESIPLTDKESFWKYFFICFATLVSVSGIGVADPCSQNHRIC